jgi:hypothetical protein
MPKQKRESVRMRAELIRVQCELARLPPDEEDIETATRRAELENRQDALLKNTSRRNAWAKPLNPPTAGCEGLIPDPNRFVRGFPDFGDTPYAGAATLLRAGEALFNIAPLWSLNCHNIQGELADRFLAAPWLARVRRLRVGTSRDSSRRTDGGSLLISSDGPDAATIEKLFAAHVLANLEELELRSWEFGRPGRHVAARALGALRKLELCGGVDRGPSGYARLGELLLAESPIREFRLAGVHYGPAELTTLAALPQFVGLERLTLGSSLGDNGTVLSLGAAGVQALAAAPFWQSLRSLRADRAGFGSIEVEALPGAPAHFRTLSLTNSPSGVVSALAPNPFLRTVTALDLSGTTLGNYGATLLAESPHLGRLLSLNLARCVVNEEGVKALAESVFAANLVRLNLDGCTIRKGGVDALVAPGNFPRLRRLEVRWALTVNAQKDRLRARFGGGVHV